MRATRPTPGSTAGPSSGYHLISADAHVNEPPDLWRSRVPRRLVERVPRVERFEQGDAWVIEGVDDPIHFGHNACAGVDAADIRYWVRFEEIRPGGYDPVARVDEMRTDGVDAEILYPTPRLSQGVTTNRDRQLHLAMVRAYNDWLSEYTAVAPARFAGLALLPNCGAADALAEIERVWGRPGMRGVVMNCYPNGTLQPTADDDLVWAALAERDTPVHIHVSLTLTPPSGKKAPLPAVVRFFDAPGRILELIFAGVFDRFPELRLVVAEVDCGWVPYFKEQLDDSYQRNAPSGSFSVADLPSRYVDRCVYFTFMNDSFGVQNRGLVGSERMMWSSDYPHISSNWPTSWRTINSTFATVPPDERRMILAGNAARLYHFSD